MAFTADQLSALEEAYAAGITTVTHAGKTFTYGSMSELWAAIQRIRADLRPASRRRRAGVAGYRKFA